MQNRELQMMRLLDHPNVITLHYFFYSTRKGYKVSQTVLVVDSLLSLLLLLLLLHPFNGHFQDNLAKPRYQKDKTSMDFK